MVVRFLKIELVKITDKCLDFFSKIPLNTDTQIIRTLETLRYPEIGVRVTGSAMFFFILR